MTDKTETVKPAVGRNEIIGTPIRGPLPQMGEFAAANGTVGLLDGFASLAMQSVYERGDWAGEEEIAKRAYKLAVAMMAERESRLLKG